MNPAVYELGRQSSSLPPLTAVTSVAIELHKATMNSSFEDFSIATPTSEE